MAAKKKKKNGKKKDAKERAIPPDASLDADNLKWKKAVDDGSLHFFSAPFESLADFDGSVDVKLWMVTLPKPEILREEGPYVIGKTFEATFMGREYVDAHGFKGTYRCTLTMTEHHGAEPRILKPGEYTDDYRRLGFHVDTARAHRSWVEARRIGR